MNDSVEPKGKLTPPTILFRLVVILAFLGLGVQLWRLQIIEGRDYRRRAEENHIREVRLPAPRGVIYDRTYLQGQSKILASNAPVFVVSIVPAELPKGREEEIYQRLSGLIGVSADEIRQKVEKQKAANELFTPVPIKSNLERSAALRIDEARLELPGVSVSVESTRRYTDGSLFAHLIGYTALISPTLLPPERYRQLTSPEGGYTINDHIGAAGIEEQYEQLLRGHFGRKRLEVDAAGRQRELGVAEKPRPGSNLVLTIDLELQRFVDQALREGLHQSPSGVAIVMDPRNGDVLALVSQPSYDNNIFSDESREDELAALLKDPNQPFFNRAIAGLYPPGSTFKLMTGIAALEEGVATRDTVIESRGAIYVEGQRLPEWKPTGLGRLNFIQAIANSSNIYFFILGGGFEKDYPSGPLRLGLGHERIARYARMFGYGAPTGIDLPNEAAGTIPDDAWKQAKIGSPWLKGDTYNMSIGQGYVQATPLQVANATNAIANGGTLYRPHLLKAIVDANGEVTRVIQPEIIRNIDVDPKNLQVIREAMEAGFSTGELLPPFRVPGLRVAAKTGTGEFAGEVNAQGELPTHGWFTSFAPADDPQISVTVFVDRGSGSKDAAPIAMRIIRHYFGIPEDAPAEPTPSATPSAPPTSEGVPPSLPRATPSAPVRPAVSTPAAPPAVQPQEPQPTPTPQPARTPRPAPTTPPAPQPTVQPKPTSPPSTAPRNAPTPKPTQSGR